MSFQPNALLVTLLPFCLSFSLGCRPHSAEQLPGGLSHEKFWSLMAEFSEPGGTFDWENLLSNEIHFPHMIRAMQRSTSGGVYIGVGPEQNFSYIAGLRPELAFIVDVRRENRNLHLMYKALFELSADRADFVSRLFSRERPEGLGPDSTAQEIFAAYEQLERSRKIHDETLNAMEHLLVVTHGFPLSFEDRRWIEYVYGAFHSDGPRIRYARCNNCTPPFANPTYVALMTASDGTLARSYLASEENFRLVKDLQEKNLILPIIGDFAGTRAIRAIGEYLKLHHATVTVFYASNVPDLLGQGQHAAFCRNLAVLPHDAQSVYIGGPTRNGGFRIFPTQLRNCAFG